MQTVKSIFIATTLLMSGNALAGTPFYAGGSLGLGEFSDYDRELGGKAYGGITINKNFAIEGGYARVRSTDDFGDTELEAIDNVLFASPVARIPVSNQFSFLGKANVAWHNYKADVPDNCYTSRRIMYCELTEVSDKEIKLGFGVGGEFDLNRMITIRAEYESFSSDVKMFSAGATVKF